MVTFSQLGYPTWGRLGNQLFQIAATLGVAHRNGQDAIFPAWSYERYFLHQLPKGVLSDVQVCRHTSVFYEFIDLSPGNWDLQGFFTSEKFFESVIHDIRIQFKPAAAISDYLTCKYGSMLSQNSCSIHVRRGDYLKLSWDFPTQPLDYYQYAIQQFSSDTLFLIFSDDISWCQEHFIGPQFAFIEGEDDIVDLFLMSRCCNHIIANSTFSWWGAWLNPSPDKIVLCPARWYGPGVSARPHHYTRDLYPKGFQKLYLPSERQWQMNLYYGVAYPIYTIWSKIYAAWLQLYSMRIIQYVIKKLKF